MNSNNFKLAFTWPNFARTEEDPRALSRLQITLSHIHDVSLIDQYCFVGESYLLIMAITR